MLKKILSVLDQENLPVGVLKNLRRYQRVPTQLNERRLYASMNVSELRNRFQQLLNPFCIDADEIRNLSKGEILLGITPEGYRVCLDVELEHCVVVAGASGTGKSNLLISLCLALENLDDIKDEGHPLGLLE